MSRQSEGEEERGEGLSPYKTSVSLYKGPTMNNGTSQRKVNLGFTNEESKGQKDFVDFAFFNQSEQACPLSRKCLSMHAELAKLVIDVEYKGPQSKPNAQLGREI